MKKTCTLIVYFAFLLFAGRTYAQQLCGFDDLHRKQLQSDPEYARKVQEMNDYWLRVVEQKKNLGAKPTVVAGDTVYEIPIVVHVVHTGEPVGDDYNRSDADILSWINFTNDVFAATAPGYTAGAKIPVKLVLAQRDPSCAVTTGIVRYDGSSIAGYDANGLGSGGPGAAEADIRAATRWPSEDYYNIYIVTQINGEDGFSSTSSFTAGYAYLAHATSPAVDGAYMLSYIVESGQTTFAHEIGHAMGLLHTFQGASSAGGECPPAETDCSAEGDLVCDTERGESNLSTVPCPTNSDPNLCTGANYAGVQNNIMNYGFCLNRFTAGQADRVETILLEYRGNLLMSKGVDPVAPAPPETAPVAACTLSGPSTAVGFNIGAGNIHFNEIHYYSAGNVNDGGPYIDHTLTSCSRDRLQTTVAKGSAYELRVSLPVPNTTPVADQGFDVYIDYDNDGTFAAAERVMTRSNVAPGEYTESVTIPATAVMDVPLRMRVVTDYTTAGSPCNNPAYGQIEDFVVVVSEPLSLDPLTFRAEAAGCRVQLDWEVKEAAFLSFEVEKSRDALAFAPIAKIATTAGQTAYSFTDEAQQEGYLYYRLKMNDERGNITYTNPQRVQVSCTQSVSLYPNPNTGVFRVRYPAAAPGDMHMTVSDMNGRELLSSSYTLQQGDNELEVDIQAMVPGVYILKMEAGGKVVQKMVTRL